MLEFSKGFVIFTDFDIRNLVIEQVSESIALNALDIVNIRIISYNNYLSD